MKQTFIVPDQQLPIKRKAGNHIAENVGERSIRQTRHASNQSVYLIKCLRISRGQSLKDIAPPYEIARSTRIKEARGLTKMQMLSMGNLLLEKYANIDYVFNFYDYEHYYIFIIEDLDGIVHEAHIFMVEEKWVEKSAPNIGGLID